MKSNLIKYFDLQYFKRFIAIFLALYYFNILYIGLVAPGGIYFPFLKQYLNYPSWLINLILHFSNIITRSTGINSYVNGHSLEVYHGSTVIMEWACIGLQIISFWIAFVVAHRTTLKKKLYWCITGIIIILVINCVRIALLSIAMEKNWRMNNNIDNHTMFNIIGYLVVTLMIYFYQRTENNLNERKVPLAVSQLS